MKILAEDTQWFMLDDKQLSGSDSDPNKQIET